MSQALDGAVKSAIKSHLLDARASRPIFSFGVFRLLFAPPSTLGAVAVQTCTVTFTDLRAREPEVE